MAFNTTIIKGRGIRKEAAAGAAVSPGDFIERDSSGEFIRNAIAGSQSRRLIAVENEIFGDGIEVDYAAAQQVLAESTIPGMEVYARLAINAAAIVIGDLVELAADGSVALYTPAVDLTEGAGAIGGTQDGDIDALVDPAGDSGASLIDGVREAAAAINAFTGQGIGNPVGVALEAVDNSAGGTKVWIHIEIL